MRATTLFLSQLWQLLLDLIFPPQCVNCGHSGTCFCDTCLAKVVYTPEPHCIQCDLPLEADEVMSCKDCRARRRWYFEGLRFVGPYAAPLREAIHALKYDRRKEVAAPLGELLATCWEERAGTRVDGLLPVPLHLERERERGFNQSALLGQVMSRQLGIPMRVDLLARTRATESQVGLSAQQRRQNMAEAFSASPEVAGKRWLLIDDVYTTGATMSACAKALHAQGARAVWAIALARPLHDWKPQQSNHSPTAQEKDQPGSQWDHEVIW